MRRRSSGGYARLRTQPDSVLGRSRQTASLDPRCVAGASGDRCGTGMRFYIILEIILPDEVMKFVRWTVLSRFLIKETTINTVILLNGFVLFVDAFPDVHIGTAGALFWIDYACLIYFILEATIKIHGAGSFAGYWQEASAILNLDMNRI